MRTDLLEGQGTSSVSVYRDDTYRARTANATGCGSAWVDIDGNYHFNNDVLGPNTLVYNGNLNGNLNTICYDPTEAEITLDEAFVKKIAKIAEDVYKNTHPLEKTDDVEVPPMKGFIEI